MLVVFLYLIALALCGRPTLSEEAPGLSLFSFCELILQELLPLLSRPFALGLNLYKVYPQIFVLYQKVLLCVPLRLCAHTTICLNNLTAASAPCSGVQGSPTAGRRGSLAPDGHLGEGCSGTVGKVFSKGLLGHAGEGAVAAREYSFCLRLKKTQDVSRLSVACNFLKERQTYFSRFDTQLGYCSGKKPQALCFPYILKHT